MIPLHIFNALAALEWKATVPAARNKAYVNGFPLSCCDHHYTQFVVITAAQETLRDTF
jgi:hypothetical protein